MGKRGNESLKRLEKLGRLGRLERLGDVCTIQSGGTPSRSKKEFWDGGTVPWVKISDFDGIYLDSTEEKITEKGLAQSSAKLFTKGTILYSIFATLGEVCILDIDAATNQAIAGITIKDEDIDQKYLYYFLCSIKPKIMRIGRGVAQNNINLSILRSLEIPIPSLEEQKKVADVLDAATALAAKRRRQLALLDTLTQSRFVEMFGDVICNSKLWKVYSFEDIASSRLGKMLDSKQKTGKNSYPYLANFNVQWFKFNLENLNEMDFDEADRIEFELKDGDLLVCEGGEIGRCAVWHDEIQPCFFQKALHRVRCNRQIIHPDYLAWWFKYNCDHDGFAAIAGAKATIAHLPGIKLKKLKVVVPPLELQEQFAEFVSEVDRQKAALRRSLTALTTLKSALMQEYFGN